MLKLRFLASKCLNRNTLRSPLFLGLIVLLLVVPSVSARTLEGRAELYTDGGKVTDESGKEVVIQSQTPQLDGSVSNEPPSWIEGSVYSDRKSVV